MLAVLQITILKIFRCAVGVLKIALKTILGVGRVSVSHSHTSKDKACEKVNELQN